MPKAKDLTVNSTPALTDYTINETIGGSGVQPNIALWQKIFDLFVASGIMSGTYASGISAAGTDQATATSLTVTKNRIDTVASGTGVKNSATEVAGFSRTVQNNGANDLLWYPFGTNQFYIIGSGLQGASTPITISPGNQSSVIAYTAGVLTII